MQSRKSRNSVLPSPWTSSAPYGMCTCFCGKTRWDNSNRSIIQDEVILENKTARTSSTNHHQDILKNNEFLKNLNKNTLILSFPHFHPNQIDAALSLCDNDLSETISLLRLRTHILKEKSMLLEKINRSKTAASNNHSAASEHVKYIPTKYNDVQIVEYRNADAGRPKTSISVNDSVNKIEFIDTSTLRLLENCEITASSTELSSNNVKTVTHVLATENKYVTAPDLIRSPATASTSSGIHSEDSEKLRIYDFIEDDPFQLPQRVIQRSADKVGIVLKKAKSGFSLKLALETY